MPPFLSEAVLEQFLEQPVIQGMEFRSLPYSSRVSASTTTPLAIYTSATALPVGNG